ncbi:MAG: dienelactone hydrolase family protein [Limnochordia bacterium]|nr:dienelactone hydrolase family protein [Limnochordia bacterium]
METNVPLPGTDCLKDPLDHTELLLDGLNRFLDQALTTKKKYRNEVLLKPPNKDQLVDALQQKRRELARYLGVVDSRLPVESLEFVCSTKQPAKIAQGTDYDVYNVRWPVLEGVFGEGLYLKPQETPIAFAIALGDADWIPHDLVGLESDLSANAQFARHLVQMGCEVVVPVLIDRDCTWSGNPAVRMTNQPHREFVYRMAYQMGRHIIGYEVQKILALVDWFSQNPGGKPVIVFGYGEGGLLALNSAALDERITGVGVSGYFGNRFRVWQEPIYRNVWRLLCGFGDAELATMVAPRALVIETSCAPCIPGPPAPSKTRQGAAPGTITTPSMDEVQEELALASHTYAVYDAVDKLTLVVPMEGDRGPGTDEALVQLLQSSGLNPSSRQDAPATVTHSLGAVYHREQRKRQFGQLCEYTQLLWRRSAKVRERFWDRADATSVETWEDTTKGYRDYFWEEVIGKCPPPTDSLVPRSRRIEENPTYDVYEVFVNVWDGVPAFAYLLVPKGIKTGEKRPQSLFRDEDRNYR